MSMVYLDENLNLTPDQQAQFQRINEELLTEIDALRQELLEARTALAQLLGEAQLDPEALSGQLDAISATQREAQEFVIDHLLQEKRLLRPEAAAREWAEARVWVAVKAWAEAAVTAAAQDSPAEANRLTT